MEATVREIRRKFQKKYTAEEKMRIVLEGLRGETSIAELCRRIPICITSGARNLSKQANSGWWGTFIAKQTDVK